MYRATFEQLADPARHAGAQAMLAAKAVIFVLAGRRLRRVAIEREPEYGSPELRSGGQVMSKIDRVDVTRLVLDIHRDLSVSPRARKPGPPERIDGMTVGIQTVTQDAPHGGEVHPDGDEILYVISGRFRVMGDSEPDTPIELGSGEACIVRKGEWHRVSVVEPGQLVNITPGPRGDHRPKKSDR